MNEDMGKVVEALAPMTREDAAIQNIFIKYFELDTEENKKDAGYLAWGNMGLHVAVVLANVILAAKRGMAGRNFRALCDLTFKLSGNDFWLKSSAFLMPLLIVSLNAVKDNVVMQEDAKTLSQFATYDILIRGTEMVPLEIFTGILYLIGGDEIMARLSTPMKLELAPYFVN
jgi:hypothetical protein